MPTYLSANTQSISDSARSTEYLRLASAIITQYGGKFLGGGMGRTIEVADGDWLPEEICAFEFESLKRAKEFYNSAEYQAVKADRLETTVSSVIFIDGGSSMAA